MSTPSQALRSSLRRGVVRKVLSVSAALALGVIGLPVALGGTPASASTPTVFLAGGDTTSPADVTNGDCTILTFTDTDCSLEAVLAVAETYSNTTITLDLWGNPSTPFTTAGTTIDLKGSQWTMNFFSAVFDGWASPNNPVGTGPLLTVTDSLTTGAGDLSGGSLLINGATFINGSSSQGSALDVLTADPVAVASSTFTNNSSTGDGGAIAAGYQQPAALTLSSDTYSKNFAAVNGGAVSIGGEGGTVWETSASYVHNVANGNGGAIDMGDAGPMATLSEDYSTFSNDSAGANGGAIDSGDTGGSSTVTTENTSFIGNSAGGDGGAIDVGDAGAGTLTDTNSTFTNNSALINGGAIDAADFGGTATLSLTGTTLTGNSANQADSSGLPEAGDGGAIDLADGESGSGGTGSATISGVTFKNNTAYNCGGALDAGDSGTSQVTISGSTFSGNASTTGNGGAIDNGDSTQGATAMTVTTSSFTDNNGGDFGGAIANADHTSVTTADITISESYFANNASTGNGEAGGAISNATYGGSGTATIETSTFVNNGLLGGTDFPERGSTLMEGSTGTMVVLRSTIDAGSVIEPAIYSKATLDMAGSIVAGTSGALCATSGGTITSWGYNIEQDASSCGFSVNYGSTGDQANVDPLLQPLVTTGVAPYEPVSNLSPAYQTIASGTTVDSGAFSLCSSPDVDQTGTTSVTGSCNIGAVDSSVTTPVYAVTFGLNGATGAVPTALSVPSGTSIVLPVNAGFTKTGDQFVGWTIGNNGNEIFKAGASFVVSGAVTFVATWLPTSTTVTHPTVHPTTQLHCTVYFATGSSHLTASDLVSLQRCASDLAKAKQTSLVIIGYSDARGALRFNVELSSARAHATSLVLARDLRRLGVTKLVVRTVGAGVAKTGRSLADDRRVDIYS